MCLKKRMQPILKVPLLQRKSWDNLPLLIMELFTIRNKANAYHHKLFKEANSFRITILASFNMIIPYDDDNTYTAASKIPIHNETVRTNLIFWFLTCFCQ